MADVEMGRGTPDDESDEFQLDKEPKASKGWLAMITNAQKEFSSYQDKMDSIDKRFASLERLASTARDREFSMFWANIQVLGPSIYSRPPVPVVTPRFNNRDQLKRMSAEFLERSVATALELAGIDDVMKQVRDDLVIAARGCGWVVYEAQNDSDTEWERVCIEHADRKDFLHEPARKWAEVGWVAKRSWLSKREMRKRFKKTSGDAYQDAAYIKQEDNDGATDDGIAKAAVWEVWHKGQNRVVWVAEGSEKLLDDRKPHHKLDGFFPCPRPAYGTTQPRSLLPVPDYVFYKDQLEEIDELTARLAALSEAVKVRGFYPSGDGEIGDAIEAAYKAVSDNVVLVPISSWALTGDRAPKDMIVWLPLGDIVNAIQALVEIRRQVIDDVYQITGLSDIMRGSTVASETLGAQQLKSQYGSIRIRDRQEELIRFARDLTRIAAEIMSEKFDAKTLIAMAQMEIPTDAEIRKQIAPIDAELLDVTRQAKAAQTDPDVQAMAKQNPEQAQKVIGEIQSRGMELSGQIDELKAKVTTDDITKFLKDEKLRPFSIDIETDSTIAPDENAQKQRATEYLTAMGSLFAQALPAVMEMPEAATLLGETIRFTQSQFRVGRAMDQVVDEFVEQMKAKSQQPAPDPNAGAQAEQQAKMAAEQQKAQIEAAKGQADAAKMKADADAKAIENQATIKREQDAAQLRAVEAQARIQELEKKLALADKQMAQQDQKFSQEMERLAFERAAQERKSKIDLASQGLKLRSATNPLDDLAGPGRATDGGQGAEGLGGDDGGAVEEIVSIADERQAETNAVLLQVAASLEALAAAQATPKEIVFNAAGKPIGIKPL